MSSVKISRALIILSVISTLTFVCLCVVFGFKLFGNSDDGQALTVPDYTGKNIDEIVPDDRFEIETVYVYCEQEDEGVILSQNPQPMSKRKAAKGEKYRIILEVSLGVRMDILPDLLGTDSRNAAGILRKMGYSVSLSYIEADDYESGTVLKMSPDPGQRVAHGDRVELFISKPSGRAVITVPDLTGLSINEALENIYNHGLREGEIDGVGKVVMQYPPKGALVLEGEKIDIYCSEENTKTDSDID